MYLTLKVYDDSGEPYSPTGTETVTFAVKHSTFNTNGTEFTDDEPLVSKELYYDGNEQSWGLHLEPEDTAELGFGNYTYEIQMATTQGDDFTVVANAKLKLTPEVN